MKQGRPSFTARGASFLRAAHQSLPQSERISLDPNAIRMLPSALTRWIVRRKNLPGLLRRLRPAVVDAIAVRDRFADEVARQVLSEGGQLIMLGAGMDTMPWRLEDLAFPIKVMEVDYPATQAYRMSVLNREQLPLPGQETVRVAMDFESESLVTRLSEAGLRPDLPSLINWMGVSYYLEEPAVRKVLQDIRTLTNPRSVFVFDFFQPRFNSKSFQRRFRRVGEPLKFFIQAEEFAAFASSNGYEVVELVSINDLANRYGNRSCVSDPPIMAAAIRPLAKF